MNNYAKWRTDKRLKGRFHEEYPDDLQVIVHDGGPRVTDLKPEVMWIRVTGCDNDIFQGYVLNQPFYLKTVKEGDLIKFVIPEGSELPLYVSEKYLEEREEWVIKSCDKCGFSELFDPPSELIDKIFPHVPVDEGSVMGFFTTFCCLCGGVQIVGRKESLDENGEMKGVHPERKAGCGLGILTTFMAIIGAMLSLSFIL